MFVVATIALIVIFGIFYSAAQKKELIPWRWAVIAISTWFWSQFLLAIFWSICDSSIQTGSQPKILYVSVGFSSLALLILYQVMNSKANKKGFGKQGNDEIMDDTSIEDL
ncbi:MAG: hypothetical protein ACI857_002145 [Arenicella sp.]|jgi:hypothetical protein